MIPEDARIIDVSIGIFWTFVQTQYGSAISATAHRWCDDPPGAIIPLAGNLVGLPVREIVPLYDSTSLTARSLANAAVAACFDSENMTGTRDDRRGQDLLSDMCLADNQKKHIALIGHFHFADELKKLGHHLDIFELEGRCEQGDIPNSRIPECLPFADIVMMTSSTIVTHSTEDILRSCRPDAVKMIVGPSVPIHPVLWEYGFDAICASVITDPKQVSIAARQGGNHKQLAGCRKVNFMVPSGRN